MLIYPTSREPTFVNGTRIPDFVDLHPDDVISIGRNYKFQFVVPYNEHYPSQDDTSPMYRYPTQPPAQYPGTLPKRDENTVSTENIETVFGVRGNVETISTTRQVRAPIVVICSML